MSNHLRNLLESLGNNDPVFFDHLSDEQREHVTSTCVKSGEQAVCFSAGEVDELINFTVIKDLVRIPYDVCWIEMMASAPGDDYVFGNLLWNFDGKLNCMAW